MMFSRLATIARPRHPMRLPQAARAGHPLRRALPMRRVKPLRDDDGDLKLFALSFTAFFVCFYSFIA